MVIFENPDTGKRAIFVHLQHTGGSSTRKWLKENYNIIYEPSDGRPVPYWHKPLCCAQHYELKLYYKFGWVRNPLDWYVSYWHRRHKDRHNWSFKYFMSLHFSRQLPDGYGNTRRLLTADSRIPKNIGMFTWRFLTAYLDISEIVMHKDWRSRWRELCLADAIAPMELGYINILKDLLGKTVGFKNETGFPHENATERKDWREYYDNEMIREVVWRDRLIFKTFPMYMDMVR